MKASNFIAICIRGLLIWLCACTPVRPLSVDQWEMAQLQDKAGLLLRVSVKVRGDPDTTWPYRLRFEIANMDRNGLPEKPSLAAPSEETGEEGWRYFLVDPGSYYVSLSDKGVPPDFPPSEYWFNVPDERTVVYMGTLSIDCLDSGFFGRGFSNCSHVMVLDETESARLVAAGPLGNPRPMATQLMKEYDRKPPSFEAASRPVGLSVGGKVDESLVQPAWTTRALKQWLLLNETGAGLVEGIGQLGSGQAAAAAFVLYTLYLPVGATFGTLFGGMAKSKWEPCIERLGDVLDDFNPQLVVRRVVEQLFPEDHSLQIRLLDRLSPTFAASEVRSIVDLSVQRVQLRECPRRGTFCVEIALLARAWDLYTQRLFYAASYVYSAASTGRPYEIHSAELSDCRPMDAYCGDDGARLLREQLRKGIESILLQFLPSQRTRGSGRSAH